MQVLRQVVGVGVWVGWSLRPATRMCSVEAVLRTDKGQSLAAQKGPEYGTLGFRIRPDSSKISRRRVFGSFWAGEGRGQERTARRSLCWAVGKAEFLQRWRMFSQLSERWSKLGTISVGRHTSGPAKGISQSPAGAFQCVAACLATWAFPSATCSVPCLRYLGTYRWVHRRSPPAGTGTPGK